MSDAVYFVWRESQRGEPVPEVWHGEKTIDGKPAPFLAKHRLTPQEAMLAKLGRADLKALRNSYRPPAIARPLEPRIKLNGA